MFLTPISIFNWLNYCYIECNEINNKVNLPFIQLWVQWIVWFILFTFPQLRKTNWDLPIKLLQYLQSVRAFTFFQVNYSSFIKLLYVITTSTGTCFPIAKFFFCKLAIKFIELNSIFVLKNLITLCKKAKYSTNTVLFEIMRDWNEFNSTPIII